MGITVLIFAPTTRVELALQPWQGCVLNRYTTQTCTQKLLDVSTLKHLRDFTYGQFLMICLLSTICVRQMGLEPIQLIATVLQTAPTLQLRRYRINHRRKSTLWNHLHMLSDQLFTCCNTFKILSRFTVTINQRGMIYKRPNTWKIFLFKHLWVIIRTISSLSLTTHLSTVSRLGRCWWAFYQNRTGIFRLRNEGFPIETKKA